MNGKVRRTDRYNRKPTEVLYEKLQSTIRGWLRPKVQASIRL